MLSAKGFEEGLVILTDNFGDAAIKGLRMDRIKEICDNKINDEGFIQLCKKFCDSSRFPPLPIEFKNAVEEWRKTFKLRNGYDYGVVTTAIQIGESVCPFCFDTGIIKIVSKDDSSVKHLMRDDCQAGKENTYKLPQWSDSHRAKYERKKIDETWFAFKVDHLVSDRDFLKKSWLKATEWMRIIKQSETYWETHGHDS